jgi:outer membrane protein TolC
MYTLNKSGDSVGPGDGDVGGFETSASLGLNKTFYNGTKISAALAFDIINLLNPTSQSATGLRGDTSISIPLLRGSGKHIVTEPLQQAERNVVYAIYDFERYKKVFAVDIAREYLDVLRRLDEVDNAAENYRNLIVAARQTRRLADAGRTPEIDFDRADQDRLKARERWIRAMGVYEGQLDGFTKLIGLPVDANVELDRTELERLSKKAPSVLSKIVDDATPLLSAEDAQKITLVGPSMKNAGPLEMDERIAIDYGLNNRLDLRTSEGKVYDAQRKIIVNADSLRAELTLFGSANMGQSRSLYNVADGDTSLRADEGIYTGLFTLNLPFERTAERNEYRDSFIALERAVRDFQNKEDEIKLAVLSSLRAMLEARESYNIQTDSVAVAEKRLKSTVMFFESGRAELSDILDAQEDLVNARNALTSAIVEYRVAELAFQRDTGLLGIDENGLFREYIPDKGDKEGED